MTEKSEDFYRLPDFQELKKKRKAMRLCLASQSFQELFGELKRNKEATIAIRTSKIRVYVFNLDRYFKRGEIYFSEKLIKSVIVVLKTVIIKKSY